MPIAVRELRHVKVVESFGHCERRWAAILCGTMVEIVTPEPSDTASWVVHTRWRLPPKMQLLDAEVR
jgi:hypothetical protein